MCTWTATRKNKMKQKVKVNKDGVYVKTVQFTPKKIDQGKALIKGLTKKGNVIWNKALLSLQ